MAMTGRPNLLAAAAARGDQTLCVVESLPGEECVLLLGGGTWYREAVRMYRCTGTGPYVAWLGAGDRNRVRLLKSHMASTSVEVRSG